MPCGRGSLGTRLLEVWKILHLCQDILLFYLLDYNEKLEPMCFLTVVESVNIGCVLSDKEAVALKMPGHTCIICGNK